MQRLLWFFSAGLSAFALSVPTVQLSYGTFQGSSVQGIDRFLGVPFAQAERLGLPKSPTRISGVQQATAFGPACPQQSTTINASTAGTSEDCLFINVIKPSNILPGAKLPVVFWIYGGGFEDGDTSQNDGSTVVARSITLGEPIIYVSANYRLSAYGFSASGEIKEAGLGNLGLRDQRFAMQWVQENIGLFGGDKNKVTIWGESAGAISVGLHLVVNDGNPTGLFRGAFMESGSPLPTTDLTAGQPFFDQLVANTGCSGSNDVLACLRAVPAETFQIAVNESPSISGFMSLQLAWQPRTDGEFIAENPQDSISRGKYARVPFVTGDCDDEGTIFSTSTLNLTTDQEAVDYLHHNYLPDASDAQFEPLAILYPSDPAQGSPFGTGDANQLSPQFKRIAAFQGDVVFQAPRRFFLQTASKTQDTWAFLFKRGKSTPFIGSSHGSDLPEFYASSANPDFQGTDALLNFVNNLNPNIGKGKIISWPKYSTNSEAPPLLTFFDPNVLNITTDTYRLEPMEAIIKLSREFP
ncbi:carotenoid ester lipase precursor [Ramaria rubella]|nr:carotenoid ester lipase precursor [Ramaria rubella]